MTLPARDPFMPVVPERESVVALRNAEAATRQLRREALSTTFPDPQSRWLDREGYGLAIDGWRLRVGIVELPNEPESRPDWWKWMTRSRNARACGNGYALYYSRTKKRVYPTKFKCTSCIDHEPCMEKKAGVAHRLLVKATAHYSRVWYTEVSYEERVLDRIRKRLSRLTDTAESVGHFWVRRWDDVLCVFSNVELTAPTQPPVGGVWLGPTHAASVSAFRALTLPGVQKMGASKKWRDIL